MGLLDKLENAVERLLEGSSGSLFRQKLQPAEIGRRLERAMLDGQRASVGSRIVPNAYEVHLHPEDYRQVEGFSSGLTRQLEGWLGQVATRRELTVLDRIQVRIVEDPTAHPRDPRIRSEITDSVRPPRPHRPTMRPQSSWQRPAAAEQTTAMPVRVGRGGVILRATGGQLVGQEFRIDHGSTSIGRSQDNVIVLDLPDVSRHHARLERNGEHVRVFDLGSTNGTRINGEAIHISDIQSGDLIQFGSQSFELVIDNGAYPGWS